MFSGPSAPITKAFLYCGWRSLPIDWELDPSHDLSNPLRQQSLHSQLEQADCIFAAFDCSTKSRAREIPRQFSDGRPAPKPLRTESHPEGLPHLSRRDQDRVSVDNSACAFILAEIEDILSRGGISIRENPLRSLHWHLPQEVAMKASNQWWDTEYAACCWGGARCKLQLLRHNVQEIHDWPPITCHHLHDPHEWDPWEQKGQRIYPSKEEAEYTAPLCFAIAVACSWWAVRTGRASLHVPRAPAFETVGRRDTWLEFDGRSLRAWAMSPLAISLGLEPIDPLEKGRLPKRSRVNDCLTPDGTLPAAHIYVGQGSHQHRLTTTKWKSPWIPGHSCTQEEWLPLYVAHICGGPLWDNLPELLGMTLVCDCAWQVPCEVDILAGLCFDATSPSPSGASSRVTGRPDTIAARRAVILATTVGRASSIPIPPPIPGITQEMVVLAFRKLFPAAWLSSIKFPMVEDLVNHPIFRSFPEWLQSRGAAWDGPLGPALAPRAIRLAQRTSEAQQAGAYSQRSSLPPLIPYGLEPDEHFRQARFLGQKPLPTENAAVLDADLHFAAFMTASLRGQLREARRVAIKVLRELHRRWGGVTSHLRQFQTPAIQRVTQTRDVGFTSLLIVLTSWPDVTYPHGLVTGLPAVGYAPCYGIFPELQVDPISFASVLGDWESHNSQILTRLRPGPDDDVALVQSSADADKGFCTHPMTRSEFLREIQGQPHRLIPRCVITQSSGKKRIIDDAAVGGQSASSRDSNKLVLCTPLRPAQHVQAILFYLTELEKAEIRHSDAFESGGEDWPDAYRHSPMARSEALLCVVTFWHHDWQAPAFQVYSGLLFGLPLAVTSFNRYSRLVESLGRRLLWTMVSMYFDDATITDWQSSRGSAQWAFSTINELLGTPFAAEKRQMMSSQGVFLGLQHSLSPCLTDGVASFWAKDKLEAKLLGLIQDAETTHRLSPGQASKIYGVANFFEQGVYGRIGCGGLAAIKARQYEHSSTLTPALRDCFGILRAVISLRPERAFPVQARPHPRFCVASDAALETPRAGSGGFLIVWFNDHSEAREAFVSYMPDALYDWFTPGDHKIAQLELIQVLFALVGRASSFRGRRGIWYIDNLAALMSLIRGRSDVADLERLSHLIHIILFTLNVWIYWEWIPSKSNWADAISRLGFSDPWFRKHRFLPHHAYLDLFLLDLPFPAVISVFQYL